MKRDARQTFWNTQASPLGRGRGSPKQIRSHLAVALIDVDFMRSCSPQLAAADQSMRSDTPDKTALQIFSPAARPR